MTAEIKSAEPAETIHIAEEAELAKPAEHLNEAAAQFVRVVVGQTLNQAQEAGGLIGVVVRVMKQDGAEFAGSLDFRTDRINLEIEAGVVKAATVG